MKSLKCILVTLEYEHEGTVHNANPPSPTKKNGKLVDCDGTVKVDPSDPSPARILVGSQYKDEYLVQKAIEQKLPIEIEPK